MPLRQITTTWSTPGGGGQTVMFFNAGAQTVDNQRFSVHSLWEGIDQELSTQVSWNVERSGNVVDEVTGITTGAFSGSTTLAGTGDAVVEPVADSTQVLIQWRTGAFAHGHEVRGRTFVPGLRVTALAAGEIESVPLGALQAAVATARTNMAGQEFRIWHRPVVSLGPPRVVERNGSAHAVTSSSVWDELAVLRRRRS